MTQASLFDVASPPPTLPYTGRSVEARTAGALAAEHASRRRGRLQSAYIDLLLRLGAHGATDHEASQALQCPVSSICSTRAALQAQLTTAGLRRGPYGEMNHVTVLRIVAGRRFDTDEEVA